MNPRRFYVDIPSDSEDSALSDDDGFQRGRRETRTRRQTNVVIPDSDDEDPYAYMDDDIADPDYVDPLEMNEQRVTDSEEKENSGAENEHPNTNVSADVCGKKNTNKSKEKVPKYVWKEGSMQYKEEDIQFLGDVSLTDEIKKLETPYDFFKYMFTENMVKYITEQTNLYATQKCPDKYPGNCNITETEISKFLGIIIYTSVVHLPATRYYWREGINFEPVSMSLTCNRFEEIKRFLHFANNDENPSTSSLINDKLHKIRPILDKLKKRMNEIPKEEYLAVDEQIIPTKARISIKQYNPKKPHKWGYKAYVLSGESGFSYDYEIYAGSQSNTIPDNCPDLGVSGNAVLRMASTIPTHLNHKIYFDNWYTGIPLVAYLHSVGILPLGTVKRSRLPGTKEILPSMNDMTELGRGSCVEIITTVNDVDVTVVSWLDNKLVNLCSSYVGKEPMGTVKRYIREEKIHKDFPCPKAVLQYNRYMGGVDLLDSMLGYYRIKIRSKKWYLRIFFHLVDLVMVNAWILWRRKNTDMYIPLLDFKLLVAETLTKISSNTIETPTTRKRGRPANPDSPIFLKKRKRSAIPSRQVAEDGHDHLPEWCESRMMCKNPGCSARSFIMCRKCRAHLCLKKGRNCYAEFHTKVDSNNSA